jgi:hypothetical protein
MCLSFAMAVIDDMAPTRHLVAGPVRPAAWPHGRLAMDCVAVVWSSSCRSKAVLYVWHLASGIWHLALDMHRFSHAAPLIDRAATFSQPTVPSSWRGHRNRGLPLPTAAVPGVAACLCTGSQRLADGFQQSPAQSARVVEHKHQTPAVP